MEVAVHMRADDRPEICRIDDAPLPVEGEDAEEQTPTASRRRRAVGLIALAAIMIGSASLADVYPTWNARPKTVQLVEASIPVFSPIPLLSQTFTSPTMGYSVKYPVGWTATPAWQIWPGDRWDWRDPDVDKLDGNSVGFHGTSQVLAPGQSAAAWMHDYLATASAQVAVDGQMGVMDLNGCSSYDLPGRIYDLAVVARGRGYNFTMEGEIDRRFFLAMIATITFGPQPATVATPALSPVTGYPSGSGDDQRILASLKEAKYEGGGTVVDVN